MKNTENKIENTESLNQNELLLIDGGNDLYNSVVKIANEQWNNVVRWYNS